MHKLLNVTERGTKHNHLAYLQGGSHVGSGEVEVLPNGTILANTLSGTIQRELAVVNPVETLDDLACRALGEFFKRKPVCGVGEAEARAQAEAAPAGSLIFAPTYNIFESKPFDGARAMRDIATYFPNTMVYLGDKACQEGAADKLQAAQENLQTVEATITRARRSELRGSLWVNHAMKSQKEVDAMLAKARQKVLDAERAVAAEAAPSARGKKIKGLSFPARVVDAYNVLVLGKEPEAPADEPEPAPRRRPVRGAAPAPVAAAAPPAHAPRRRSARAVPAPPAHAPRRRAARAVPAPPVVNRYNLRSKK